jgi:N,N-dimethylformamidase
MNMRPTYEDPLFDHAFQLSADLHVVDWLHEQGERVDVVTDADVHHEGAELLKRYRVVVSGCHAEYPSGPLLDALQGYLEAGGRYMYLSGNGLYNVTALDPEEGHTVEIRRTGACHGPWYCEPGESCLSTTGENGGTWRWRGRAPQALVGVGYCAAHRTHAGTGRPYRRSPASRDPRARFVFEGVEHDVIGDIPNRVHRHGAAGYELDRADASLGTPAHALVLATASGFDDENWMPALEEPGGGAVFSVGSISWCGALSYNDYDNDVSRVTGNVLRRFLLPEPFELPASS